MSEGGAVRSVKIIGAVILTAFCGLCDAACPDPVNIQLQLNASLICVVMNDTAHQGAAAAARLD
jgi:hypothetical protein